MRVVVVAVIAALLASSSFAATPQEEYKKIQERLLEQKKKLSATQEKETSILTELETMSASLGKIEASLRKYRDELRRTESEMRRITEEIAKIKARLAARREWMKRKLRTMNRYGNSPDALIAFLDSRDMSEMLRTWKYLEQITLHEHRIMEEYRDNLQAMDEKNRELEAVRVELRKHSEKVRGKEAELAVQRRTKEELLSTVRSEKASHQKMLRELREASQRLLDIVRESSKTDTYGASGFSKLKGKLPWPVNGKVAIPYGSQKDPQFSTPVFRTGVHIKTENDSEAKCVHSGKVIFADWFKGFGQLVIVNHGGGYHSLYGNLSEIFSHVGDIIKDNQTVGKIGTSGILNAPGLYFEIRYKGKPLDPVQWLRVRRG